MPGRPRTGAGPGPAQGNSGAAQAGHGAGPRLGGCHPPAPTRPLCRALTFWGRRWSGWGAPSSCPPWRPWPRVGHAASAALPGEPAGGLRGRARPSPDTAPPPALCPSSRRNGVECLRLASRVTAPLPAAAAELWPKNAVAVCLRAIARAAVDSIQDRELGQAKGLGKRRLHDVCPRL